MLITADDEMDEQFSLSTLNMIRDIAQTCSLSKSARRLNRRQANLSRALMKFETETGLRVFDRTVRPAVITPVGQQLLVLIEQHLSTYQALHHFIDGYKKIASGTVRIDAPSGQLLLIARYVLPQLHQRYPDIRVELFTSNLTDRDMLSGVMLHEECDILFTYTLPANENLLAYNVITISMNVYGTAGLIEKHPVTGMGDYANAPCILFHSFMQEGSNVWQFQQAGERTDLRVQGSYRCDNAWTALELARSGLGYLYIPDLLVKEVSAEGILHPTLPAALTAGFTTYMIYKPRAQQPYRVEVVLNTIRECLRQFNGQKREPDHG